MCVILSLLLLFCVQLFGLVVSELNMPVSFPLLHLSNEMAAKWDDLEKAQTAVIRNVYFLLWNRCRDAKKGKNAAEEWSKLLLKAVSERDRVLQGLLDTAMDFRRSRRRFEVRRRQGVWQVSMCAAGVACLLCQ